MTSLREPRPYRFARYLARALDNPDIFFFVGAGWVTYGAWTLNHAVGAIVLGAFFLVVAVMVMIRAISKRSEQ